MFICQDYLAIITFLVCNNPKSNENSFYLRDSAMSAPSHTFFLYVGVKRYALSLFMLHGVHHGKSKLCSNVCKKSRWSLCASVSLRRTDGIELRGSSYCPLGTFTPSRIDYSVRHVIRPLWKKWARNRKEEEGGLQFRLRKDILYVVSIKGERKTRSVETLAHLSQNLNILGHLGHL